ALRSGRSCCVASWMGKRVALWMTIPVVSGANILACRSIAQVTFPPAAMSMSFFRRRFRPPSPRGWDLPAFVTTQFRQAHEQATNGVSNWQDFFRRRGHHVDLSQSRPVACLDQYPRRSASAYLVRYPLKSRHGGDQRLALAAASA